MNAALAAVLLVFLIPVFTHLAGRSRSVQVMLVVISVPFALLAALCLVSAARPGTLGRLARKARARRG